jgi:hypothetical protein
MKMDADPLYNLALHPPSQLSYDDPRK